MPLDANGNYSLPNGYRATSGDNILPSQHNPPLEDIAAAMSQMFPRDGRAPATGNWNLNGNKMTGLADGTNPQDAATVGQAASAIGDFKSSARVLDDKWLRRDGALYNSADYPDLAAVLPALPDGVSWTNTNAITSGTVRGVVKTSIGFLMMVDDGANARVFTTDNTASTWSQVATITGFRVFNFVLQSGIYLAIDGNGFAAVSNDGLTWSAPAKILTFTAGGGVAFAFGLFVAFGDAGKVATSPDGVTWTARTSGVSALMFKAKLVNGVLVAVGTSGAIITSTDAINWTVRASGVTASLYDVTHDGAQYVVVGSGGTIVTSPNLVSWTVRTSGTTQDLNGVAYSASGLLAAGNAGTVRISTNGTSWAASITGTSVSFTCVTFDLNNAAKYFVGGSGALYVGIRTLPTQFKTPSDDPTYGWIKAKA